MCATGMGATCMGAAAIAARFATLEWIMRTPRAQQTPEARRSIYQQALRVAQHGAVASQ